MDYYNKISKSYNELHKEEQLKKISLIKRHIKLNKNSLLLDVGSGTGISTKPFKNKCTAISLDPSYNMLKKSPCIKIQAEAENLPFKDKAFDAVISITAIQNFLNIEKAIKEIERVAKGQIIISVIKKSKKLDKIKGLLKNYKQIEEEKDIIFIENKYKKKE